MENGYSNKYGGVGDEDGDGEDDDEEDASDGNDYGCCCGVS